MVGHRQLVTLLVESSSLFYGQFAETIASLECKASFWPDDTAQRRPWGNSKTSELLGNHFVEPFSISCTTCQARLRVRDASAIGQILACPKCGSMVMIQAPDSAGAAPVDTQPSEDILPGKPVVKVDSDGISDSDSSSSNPTPTSPTDPAVSEAATPSLPTGAPRPTRKFRFREDFEASDEAVRARSTTRAARPVPPPQRQAKNVAPPSEDQLPPAGPAVPPEATISPETARYPQWLILGAAAVLGIVLALIVVGIVASRAARNGIEQTPVVEAADEPESKSEDVVVSPNEPPVATTDGVDEKNSPALATNKAGDDEAVEPPVEADGDSLSDNEQPAMAADLGGTQSTELPSDTAQPEDVMAELPLHGVTEPETVPPVLS